MGWQHSYSMLPNIEAVASTPGFVHVSESPHEKLSQYIEIAWTFSTVFGILLFMLDIAILCWVKFRDIGTRDGTNSGRIASIVATVLLILGFAVHFYRTLVKSARGLEELETMVSQLQSPNLTYDATV